MLFNTELTNKSVPCVIYMLWFNFIEFILGMVMYDIEFVTEKKRKFKPRIKLNHNIYTNWH